MIKVCTICKIPKVASTKYFYKCGDGSGNLRSECKICGRDAMRRDYRKHLKKRKESGKKWTLANLEKSRASNKKWHLNHPDSNRKAGRERMARIRSTVKGKLNCNIKNGIWCSLKRGTKRGQHWEDLVGWTVEQLKAHLENLFTPEMNWENYGSYWEIDHKIPLSAFNFEKPEDVDFKKAWKLSNLQPLEKIKNRSKRDNLDKPFQPSLLINV